MNYKHAISIRHSNRSYLPNNIEPSIIEKLQSSIDSYNQISGLNIQLIIGNGDAFKGLGNSYGMFSGVNNYIAMVGKANGVHEKEKVGYYGEKLLLEATEYGLGTCWVGGTFNRDSCVCQLAPREDIFCVIPLGYPTSKASFKDKLIKNVMSSKKKPTEAFFDSTIKVPDWFIEGIQSVRLAPSALNKQPVMFSYNDADNIENKLPSVRAWVTSNKNGYEQIDLGIAKLHFEIGSSDGSWEWDD